jgi:ABC-type multidrug transport system fused ATPase/permease subunit
MEKRKNHTKETLSIYFKAALAHKPSLFVVIFSVIIASVAGVVIPLFLKDFFNIISTPGAETKALISIAITVAILKGIEWLFWRSSTFAVVGFSNKVMAELSNKAFAYLHGHSFGFFNNNFVGSLVKRVRSFYHSFDELADNVFWEFIPLIVNVSVIFVVLFRLNIVIGVGVLAWLALYLVLSLAFAKYKLGIDLKRTELETATTGLLADTITNNGNVKLWNGSEREKERFAGKNEELRRMRNRSYNLNNIYDAIQGILTGSLEVGILFVAIGLWAKGALTVGDFVLIQSYLLNIFMRIWGFGRVIRRIYESLSDADDMTEVLVAPHEVQDIPGAKELEADKGEIVFDNVSFHYGGSGREVINGLNLGIRPGEKVAFVGKSGAGKTTITKLLLRMHDVTSGKITIDGQDISKVTQESLWRSISLVPQDPILFHRPLIENIKYGNPSATDKEVIEAAKAANCHEFIDSLSEGYDTYVGERGVKLSGGERQRVAIARAILRNAPILVLDEATSSLDSEAESLIQEALERLMKGKTVIVIAHRLSTIRKMDRIIVMENGNISEEGAHEKLIADKKSIYGKLWNLQAGGFVS